MGWLDQFVCSDERRNSLPLARPQPQRWPPWLPVGLALILLAIGLLLLALLRRACPAPIVLPASLSISRVPAQSRLPGAHQS